MKTYLLRFLWGLNEITPVKNREYSEYWQLPMTHELVIISVRWELVWAKDKHENGHVLFISPVNTMHLCWIRLHRVVPCGWARMCTFLSLSPLLHARHTRSLPHSHTHCATLSVSALTALEASSECRHCPTWRLTEPSPKQRGHVSVEDVMLPDWGYLEDVTEQTLLGL